MTHLARRGGGAAASVRPFLDSVNLFTSVLLVSRFCELIRAAIMSA